VAGDKVAVEGADVVPSGKLVADAMETLTVAGPDVPGAVVLPPPPPQAARPPEINRTNSRKAVPRNVPADVFMVPSFMVSVERGSRFSYRKTIRAAKRTPPSSIPWT